MTNLGLASVFGCQLDAGVPTLFSSMPEVFSAWDKKVRDPESSEGHTHRYSEKFAIKTSP